MSEDLPSRDGPELSSGGFDLEVFEQGEVWRDAEGWWYPVAEMSEAERSALRAWLREHSRHFYVQRLRQALLAAAVRRLDDSLDPSRADEAQLPDLIFLTPAQWLEETALMRALRRR